MFVFSTGTYISENNISMCKGLHRHIIKNNSYNYARLRQNSMTSVAISFLYTLKDFMQSSVSILNPVSYH
jgi:capsule polysaccharide export protein KpsE/RkpR